MEKQLKPKMMVVTFLSINYGFFLPLSCVRKGQSEISMQLTVKVGGKEGTK
jgi:hypothetical protein